jgi:hypothetical protein
VDDELGEATLLIRKQSRKLSWRDRNQLTGLVLDVPQVWATKSTLWKQRLNKFFLTLDAYIANLEQEGKTEMKTPAELNKWASDHYYEVTDAWLTYYTLGRIMKRYMKPETLIGLS